MSNGYALLASETTTGTTPSSGYRRLEVATDGHKTRDEVLRYEGLRPSASAPSTSGRRIIAKGGEGTIEVPGFANGLGILLRAAASTAASAVHSGGTDAYDQTYTWTAAGPPTNRAITTEIYRDRKSGTYDAFTYSGGRVTSLEIGQDLDQHLMLKFIMDYLSVARPGSLPSRTPTIVEPDFIYAWPDAQIILTPDGGSPSTECVSSFGLTLPTEVDVNDWCLKRGTTRHEPLRKGRPSPTGKIDWKYQAPTYYDAFRAGTVFSLEANWLGSTVIEGSTYPGLTIEVPAIAFTGEDPEITKDEATTQALPFEVLDNGTDPAVTITVVTSDTTY